MKIVKFDDFIKNKELRDKFVKKILNISEKKIFFLLKEERLYNIMFSEFSKNISCAIDLLKKFNTLKNEDKILEIYNFEKMIFTDTNSKVLTNANKFLRYPIHNSEDVDNSYAIYSNYETFTIPIYLDKFKKLKFRLNFCLSFAVFCDRIDYSKTYIKYKCEMNLNFLDADEYSKIFIRMFPTFYEMSGLYASQVISTLLEFFKKTGAVDIITKAEQIKVLKPLSLFCNKYDLYINKKLKINNIMNEILKDFRNLKRNIM